MAFDLQSKPLQWAPRFLSRLDGVNGVIAPARPELCRIRSVSQTGRLCRPRGGVQLRRSTSPSCSSPRQLEAAPEVQLVSFDIRGKVAQQHSVLENAASKAPDVITPRPRGREAPKAQQPGRLEADVLSCVASVVASKPGGFMADYVEAQQIGLLYEKWRVDNMELPQTEKKVKKGRGRLPKATLGDTGRGRLAINAPVQAIATGQEAAKGQSDTREKSRMEKLFTVLTDSRVRSQKLAEHNMSEGSSSELPTFIEVYPPLELCKLYKGLWRLEGTLA